MQAIFRNTLVFLFIFLFSCGSKDNDRVRLHLDAARKYYSEKEFQKAKQEIDSIHILYPRAFEERRAAIILLDSVRRGENKQTIDQCDSLIALYLPELEKMKAQFSYQRDKQYQDAGAFIPKESVNGGIITGTTLRSGVGDDGILYLESVFVGGKHKHNQLQVATKDGSFVETQPENGDGLNYRFSNMGKEYEVIRFLGLKENRVAKFIFVNRDKSLSATLKGQNKYSYTLSQNIKSSVSKSFQLSTMMLQLDSLKTAKERAEYFNFELDKKKDEDAEDLFK